MTKQAKRYKIRYCYNSGDSGGPSDKETCILEPTWTSLEAVTENLERIKQHYAYYNHRGDKWWHNQNHVKQLSDKTVQTMPWYADGKYHEDEVYCGCFPIVLRADNGNPIKMRAPWCGVFETLHWAEVIEVTDPLPRIEFGY